MLWYQGESDAVASKGALYKANLKAVIARLRADLSSPNLLFMVARVRDFYGLTAQSNLVRAAQVTIADEDANVEWFDTDTFNPLHNGGHHATAGQLQVGNAFADTYLASAGTPAVSPPSTPPPPGPTSTPTPAGGGGNAAAKARVFLMVGQSNMLGQGVSAELTPPYSTAFPDVRA